MTHEERSEKVVSVVEGLRKFYTKVVFPDKVMKILNNGLRLQHVLPAGVEPTGELRVSLLLDLSMELHEFLLHVDEKPTLTRFWTFEGCANRMLLMDLLDGFPRKVFTPVLTKPRPQNLKRVTSVFAFFEHPECRQFLKRTCLAMQITSAVTNVTGEGTGKPKPQAPAGTGPPRAPDDPAPAGLPRAPPAEELDGDVPANAPPLVKVCTGKVRRTVQATWSEIMANLHLDRELRAAAAATVLLGTACGTLMRFRQYEAYPAKLCKMCKAWFTGFVGFCLDFLRTDPADLDTGLSKPLWDRAWAEGSERRAIEFLTRPDVQAALELCFLAAAISSLPVERRHPRTYHASPPPMG